MTTSFVLTKDLIEESYPVIKETEQIKKDFPKRFRLLDCDENIYFYGRMTDTDETDEFEPLDTLGAGYGCTDIQVWENDKWETV